MIKKESYKHLLPHFQQPGQAYFVTWCLKDAMPPKALKRYFQQLEILKSQLQPGAADSDPLTSLGVADSDPPFNKSRIGVRDTQFKNSHHTEIEQIKKEYNALRKKYIKAYNDLLDAERNPKVDLSKPENTKIVVDTLKYWEGKKLTNHAFCVMPNHVHWVFELFEKDEKGEPVYLQDILYSVKRFSAGKVNKLENHSGSLWQKESFDTTIRDEKHLYNAVEYTLNNPVSAGFVKDWKDWPGTGVANSDSPIL